MTNATHIPTRHILAVALGAALTAAALPVAAMERIEAQNLPRYISESSFQSLSQSKLHDIDIAQKRGEQVLIGDYGPSQSRKAVDQALTSGSIDSVSQDSMVSDFLPGASPKTR